MRKTLMIGLLIIGLFTSCLMAQSNVTLIGGINFGTVKYSNSDVEDFYDISPNTGLILGLETDSGPFKIGVSYIQRGVSANNSNYDIEITETYNYIAAHCIIPASLSKQFSLIGGLQIGKNLGGSWETDWDGNSDSGTYDAEDFNVDFGLLFGADIMLDPKFGVRGTYYYGLSDIVENLESSSNFKNRGLAFCLLLKL